MLIFLLLLLPLATLSKVTIPWTAPATRINWNCNSTESLDIEEARVNFTYSYTTNPAPLYVYGRSSICHKCLYLPLTLSPINNVTACIIIDTNFPFSILASYSVPFNGNTTHTNRIKPNPRLKFVKFTKHFDTHSHYNVTFVETNENYKTYHIDEVSSGNDKYMPLYVAIAAIVGLLLIYNAYIYYKNKKEDEDFRYKQDFNLAQGNNNLHYSSSVSRDEQDETVNFKKKRYASLDSFRGMSLIIMIFVNYGGGGYWWLNHSIWNGLTIADLVFPWFVFIMGTAMAITFPRKLNKMYEAKLSGMGVNDEDDNQYFNSFNREKKATQKYQRQKFKLIKTVVIRGIKLFLIGFLFINGDSARLHDARIPGVLQYFSIAYVFVGVLIILTEPRQDIIAIYGIPSKANLYIPEIAMYWKQWVIVMAVLGANLALVFNLQVKYDGDKCPKGYLGPGGIGNHGKYLDCTGGAHGFVDYKVFGYRHLYHYPTARKYYATGTYDPEGLLGSLTCIVLCFLGLFVGRLLQLYDTLAQRVSRWIFYGVILGITAGILCNFSMNSGIIPINKNLWSLSFILCQASTGSIIFSVFYVLIDEYSLWDGKPFKWIGMNSIIVYVGSELLQEYFPFSWKYGDVNHTKLLASNIQGVLCWIIIAYLLYKNKTFYSL